MKFINPLDYELNEAKKIVETISSKNKPVFLIYLNPQNIRFKDNNIFPICFHLLRQKGIRVATHAIYSDSGKDLAAFLKIQNSEILFFPTLMHKVFPKNCLIKFPKILFELGYSVITCCPHCNNLDDLEKYSKLLRDIGYEVKIIKEDYYPSGRKEDLPYPSKESIEYVDLLPINTCNLASIPIDIKLYEEIKKSTCNKLHNEFESYEDDIYKVNTEYEAEITEMLSILSQMECCWADRVITKEAIEQGLHVYISIENSYVKGYAAFEERSATHQITGNKEIVYMLGEIYTCYQFREKGVSSKLIDYAIDDLNINTNTLYVSGPVMPAAQKIIAERVGEHIILEQEGRLHPYTKDDIKKLWGIF